MKFASALSIQTDMVKFFDEPAAKGDADWNPLKALMGGSLKGPSENVEQGIEETIEERVAAARIIYPDLGLRTAAPSVRF